jgi:hypothetical protein
MTQTPHDTTAHNAAARPVHGEAFTDHMVTAEYGAVPAA